MQMFDCPFYASPSGGSASEPFSLEIHRSVDHVIRRILEDAINSPADQMPTKCKIIASLLKCFLSSFISAAKA